MKKQGLRINLALYAFGLTLCFQTPALASGSKGDASSRSKPAPGVYAKHEHKEETHEHHDHKGSAHKHDHEAGSGHEGSAHKHDHEAGSGHEGSAHKHDHEAGSGHKVSAHKSGPVVQAPQYTVDPVHSMVVFRAAAYGCQLFNMGDSTIFRGKSISTPTILKEVLSV